MIDKIFDSAKALQDYVVTCRHALHQIPELRSDLPQTVAYVTARLREMEIPFEIIENGGIVAEIGSGSHTFLLRADMDALPVKEESGETFASTNGNMHACGHDLHTAMLLGAAKLLKAREATLPGRVRLVFQSNEEDMVGMHMLLQKGLLADGTVGGALALHVLPGAGMDAGTYSCRAGAANTAVDKFHIDVHGVGVHGAMQYKGHDPINAGIQIYNALANMIAREIDVRAGAILSTCYFIGGSRATYNVIPDSASLGGSIRSFDSSIAEYVKNRISEISRDVASAFHTEAVISFPFSSPACCNEKNLSDLVNCVAADCGMENRELTPQLVSDDFSYLSQQVPSCYVWLGVSGSEEKFSRGCLHSPNICFNDEALSYGVALLAGTALRWLEQFA